MAEVTGDAEAAGAQARQQFGGCRGALYTRTEGVVFKLLMLCGPWALAACMKQGPSFTVTACKMPSKLCLYLLPLKFEAMYAWE